MSWRWPNFTPQEMACKGTGQPFPLTPKSMHFLDCLQLMRTELGFPLVGSSWYRSPEHNAAEGGAEDSAHLTAEAGDIVLYGNRAFKLIEAAPRFGFTGIGVSQKGDHDKRFVHLDTKEGTLRPWLWSY